MKKTLALEGGPAVRRTMLSYGRQDVNEDDISAVVNVLRGDWLTTGPSVDSFERALAVRVGARQAVTLANGTAALHAAYAAIGVRPGDEVIVPPMTFAATANAALYLGAKPIFADVDPSTLLLDPEAVARSITPRTRAIVGVDYAGQPCDWDALRDLANPRGIKLVADACHALGAAIGGRPVGSLADVSVFSFHPVKHVTTGEGGAATTDDEVLAARMRVFRNHGIVTDHRQRAEKGSFHYEMTDLGYNYRLTDFQCALGESQLKRLDEFVKKRQSLAAYYDTALRRSRAFEPLLTRAGVSHSYHLYVGRLPIDRISKDRAGVFTALRAEGIGANVHYLPVHLHPYYRRTLGTRPGICPVAEAAYERILTLPLFPSMSMQDAADVVTAVDKVVDAYVSGG